MDKEIHKAFLDGIHEVYSIMFTDGVNDGIELFLFSEDNNTVLYRERKVKRFKKPVLLVAKVVSGMQVNDVQVGIKILDNPVFTVPYKSLLENNINCQTEKDWEYLNSSYVKFHDMFYEVKKVSPNTFIEDSFMTVAFECEYRKDITDLLIEEEEDD